MPTYKFKCVFTRNGAGVAPGSAPTVTIVDTSNTVLVNAASASSLSNLAGVYYYNYTGSAADCIAKFVTSDATVDEPEKYDYTPQVITDYIDASIAAVKAKTDNLPTDPADQSAVEAAITAAAAPLMTSAGYTAPDNAGITAIKAKTDNLPSDPADQSTLEAAITAATSPLMTSAGYTAPDNAGIAAIKAKTDNLPASPAATGAAMTLTSGERSTLAALIIANGSGSVAWPVTITDAGGTPIADVEVWLTSDIDGNSPVARGYTDTAGETTLHADAGSYYLWQRKTGWTFTNPTAVTIS